MLTTINEESDTSILENELRLCQQQKRFPAEALNEWLKFHADGKQPPLRLIEDSRALVAEVGLK